MVCCGHDDDYCWKHQLELEAMIDPVAIAMIDRDDSDSNYYL